MATFTIDRSLLSTTLSRIARTALRKHVKTALTVARITVNGDVRIAATDLETTHREILNCGHNGKSEICVNANLLAKTVRSSKAKQLTLSIDENGVTIGKSTIPSAIDPDEVPAVNSDRFENPDASWSGLAELFAKTVESVIYAVDVDSMRFALGRVLFEISDDKLLCVATDGRRLSVAWDTGVMPYEPDNADMPFIVPKLFLETVLKAIKAVKKSRNAQLRIEFKDNFCYVEISDDGRICSQFTSRLIEGRFPKWRGVLPKTSDMTDFVIDPDTLKDTLKACKTIDQKESRGIDLTVNLQDNNLAISYQTENGKLFEIVPIRRDSTYPDGFSECTLDWRYVRDVLIASNESVRFYGLDADNAVLLETSNCYAVIMPLARN